MPTTLAPAPARPGALPSEADLRAFAERGVRFTAEEFHRLGETGVLGEDARVELIDGHLIAMSPVGSRHLQTVIELTGLFSQRLYATSPPLARLSVQNPIRLDDGTEPIPDLALLHPDAPRTRVPRPEDVLLVVEVADTSADFDRDVKRPRYAAAGIGEVWLVLPAEGVVEAARRPEATPSGATYAEVIRHGADARLGVAALPDLDPLPIGEMSVPEP